MKPVQPCPRCDGRKRLHNRRVGSFTCPLCAGRGSIDAALYDEILEADNRRGYEEWIQGVPAWAWRSFETWKAQVGL